MQDSISAIASLLELDLSLKNSLLELEENFDSHCVNDSFFYSRYEDESDFIFSSLLRLEFRIVSLERQLCDFDDLLLSLEDKVEKINFL